MKAENYWGKENINLPKNYIFNYGVAVNTNSRQTNLKGSLHASPSIPVRVSPKFGYIRSWNYRSTYGKTVLGLERASKNTTASINGIIVPVDNDAEFFNNAVTPGFTLIEIPSQFVEAAGWQELPKKAKYWTFIIDASYFYHPDKKHPITQTYLDMTLQGFLEYGIDYAKEFLETTFNWSPYWLNDRVMARNPWYYAGHYEDYDLIDTILSDYFNDSELKRRKFSEEYMFLN